jgi:broad specificity phosphatase PhoE
VHAADRGGDTEDVISSSSGDNKVAVAIDEDRRNRRPAAGVAEAQHRICQELQALASQHEPNDLLACFSHADPIRLAVTFYIGLPLDQFQRLVVNPGSLSMLHISDNSARLLTLNYDPAFFLALAGGRK